MRARKFAFNFAYRVKYVPAEALLACLVTIYVIEIDCRIVVC